MIVVRTSLFGNITPHKAFKVDQIIDYPLIFSKNFKTTCPKAIILQFCIGCVTQQHEWIQNAAAALFKKLFFQKSNMDFPSVTPTQLFYDLI